MAIAFVTAASGSSTASSTDSFSITITAATDLVVVGVGAEDTVSANTDVSDVTINGVSCTQQLTRKVGTTTLQNTELWDMLDSSLPGAGTYTVAITCGGACDSVIDGAIAVSGADQAAPDATDTGADSASSTSFVSGTVTSLVDGSWYFDAFGGGTNSALTPQDGEQTERVDVQAGTATLGMSTEELATAGGEDLGWTYASINRVSQCVACYAPAAAAGRAQINPMKGPMFMRRPV